MPQAVRKVLFLALCAAIPPLSSAAAQAGSTPAVATAAIPATPLATLVAEAAASNPEVQAAEHGWRAAAAVPKQARALPETQLSVQELSVGSPRPLAGFNNSDFAYVGVGASQDFPYPGKRALRATMAAHKAESLHEDVSAVRRPTVEALMLTDYQLALTHPPVWIRQSSHTRPQH